MKRLISRLSVVVLAVSCAVCFGAGVAWASSHDQDPPLYPQAAAARVAYGTVSSVESGGAAAGGAPRGSGAVIGGILGAVVGRQVAESSHGKNIGAAVGAGVGALIGHEIEKSVRRDRGGVRIGVRLDDGSTRHFDVKDRDSDGLRVGDRVRIDGGRLYRLS